MAESIQFDFLSTGADRLARDFTKTGDTATLAAKGARLCADALDKQKRAADASAGASLALARADKILEEAEHGLRDGALEAEFALKRQAAAERQARDDALELAAAQKAVGDGFDNMAKKAGSFSLKGAGLSLLPSVIPAIGGILPAIGAVTASLGGAGIVAGGFASLAKTAFTQTGKDAQKLAELNKKLNSATTAAQKKTLQQQIAALKATMPAAEVAMAGTIETIKAQWHDLAMTVAAPTLVPWLGAASQLLKHLRPLIQPVADLFASWGRTIDQYFASKRGSDELNRIATSLGKFGADQMSAIGVFLSDAGKGIANLGRLLAAHGVDFGAFSVYLDQWGGAFLRWSQSASARKDVTKFLEYVHQNGPVVHDLLKNLGGVLKLLAPGLSGVGQLELKAVTDFLGFVASLPPSLAKPLVEVGGALLVLSKLGVLKVGIKLVGTAAKLLTGGAIDIGGGAAAATAMRTAFETGGTSAAVKIEAALAGGGTTAATEIGASGTAVGTGAATGIGAAAAGIGAGIGAAFVLYTAENLAKSLGQKAGKALGLPQAPGGTVGKGLALGLNNLAQQLPVLGPAIKGFEGLFGVDSPLAKAPGVMARAQAAVKAATDSIAGDFKRQGDAAQTAYGDIGRLTQSIAQGGLKTTQTHVDRAVLIQDMQRAGVNARTARTDVDKYSAAVAANGAQSDQARAARKKLNADIETAVLNSRQGKTDLGKFTAAVQNHSAQSDAVRKSRQRLIQDLINAGVDAQTAKGKVDTMQTSINNMKGKNVNVTITADGHGGVKVSAPGFPTKSILMSSAANPYPGGISGRKAAGGFISVGTGPTADDVPAMLSKGELVVPAHMVKAGAVDHLRGQLPGFAAGGAAGGAGAVARNTAALPGQAAAAAGSYAMSILTPELTSILRTLRDQILAASIGGSGGDLGTGIGPSRAQMEAWFGPVADSAYEAGVNFAGAHILVNKKVAAAVARIGALVAQTSPGYVKPSQTGGFRTGIGASTSNIPYSMHQLGLAIDVNWQENPYLGSHGTITAHPDIIRDFAQYGWFWGGNWGPGSRDQMHFQLRYPGMSGVSIAGLPGPGGGATPKGSIQQIAMALLRQFGWGNQWGAFNALEMSEAGWSMTARNPSSGAYGLAQFINGPSEYFQYGGNPNTAQGQLLAMMNYISNRYGSPAAAWAFHQAHNWYGKGGLVNTFDRGGWLPPGASIAVNNTGRPEKVIPGYAAGGPVPAGTWLPRVQAADAREDYYYRGLVHAFGAHPSTAARAALRTLAGRETAEERAVARIAQYGTAKANLTALAAAAKAEAAAARATVLTHAHPGWTTPLGRQLATLAALAGQNVAVQAGTLNRQLPFGPWLALLKSREARELADYRGLLGAFYIGLLHAPHSSWLYKNRTAVRERLYALAVKHNAQRAAYTDLLKHSSGSVADITGLLGREGKVKDTARAEYAAIQPGLLGHTGGGHPGWVKALQAALTAIWSIQGTVGPAWNPGNLGASHHVGGGVLRFDRGGLLPVGLSLALNATGRPEQVTPAGAGGGDIHIHLHNQGVIGSQQQMDAWLTSSVNRLARTGYLSSKVKV